MRAQSPATPHPDMAFVRRKVLAALREHAGDADNSEWVLRKIGQNRNGLRFRIVFKAHNAATTTTYAVKWDDDPGINTANRSALAHFASKGLNVVEPVFQSDTGHVLGLTWEQAPRLDQRLGDPDRTVLIRGAGAWLKKLHALSRQAPSMRNYTNAATRLRSRFPDASAPDIAPLLDKLHHLSQQLGTLRVTPSLLHWDFAPQNLFVTARGLKGADMGGLRAGVPLHDVAQFLSRLDILRMKAACSGNAWPDTHLSDKRAFFQGYGRIWGRSRKLLSLKTLQCLLARRMRQLEKQLAKPEDLEVTRICLDHWLTDHRG